MNEARRPSPESAPLPMLVRDALLAQGTAADAEAVIRRACARAQRDQLPEDALALILFVCGPLHEAAHELIGAEAAFGLVSELRPTLELAVGIDSEAAEASRRPRSGVIRPLLGTHPPASGVLTEPPPESGRPDTVPYLGTPSRRGDVVVVEPDGARRRELSIALGQKGFDVVAAADGASALLLSQRLRPAALVVAEHMSEISGVELAHVLHESDRILSTPVVIMCDEARRETLPERAWWAPAGEGTDGLLRVLGAATRRPFAPRS